MWKHGPPVYLSELATAVQLRPTRFRVTCFGLIAHLVHGSPTVSRTPLVATSLLVFLPAKGLLDFPQFRNRCWNWVFGELLW
jgi:hypothetical protein